MDSYVLPLCTLLGKCSIGELPHRTDVTKSGLTPPSQKTLFGALWCLTTLYRLLPWVCCVERFLQATAGGSPAHPSYPAGHAVQNGAFATVLKVRQCRHTRCCVGIINVVSPSLSSSSFPKGLCGVDCVSWERIIKSSIKQTAALVLTGYTLSHMAHEMP